MAGASQVEFPGKKRQRLRMRGTKQANLDTQKRLRKNLDTLLDRGEELLPAMTWTGRLKWGRTDPVTKTLASLRKVLDNRHNKKWLGKKMMAKRGDNIAKALAGALMAAHDTEISIVGNYQHQSFGSASFVRRGDGKPAYQAGVQNHHMPTLRMIPWETHARAGYHFFSWKGGFVCSGPIPTIPEGWLDEVLEKSRFSFTKRDNIWITKSLDFDKVKDNEMCADGYLLLNFIDGSKVGIDFKALSTIKGKKSFVHDLALSMLPPNLSTVMTPDAIWVPEGCSQDGARESIDRVLDGWVGLTLNEGSIAQRVKIAVLANLDEGFVVAEKWFANAEEGITQLKGSTAEKELALILLNSAKGSGVRISQRGDLHERDGDAVEISAKSLNDVLSALWSDHGQAGLEKYGLAADEAEELWSAQLAKMRPFGKFLRELSEKRSKASVASKFPYKRGKLPGAVGYINDLILTALVDGMGTAEKLALSKKGDIDKEASAWAWLVAAGRSAGQDWQFSPNARDRGRVWSGATIIAWKDAKALVEDQENDYSGCLEKLRVACGQIETF